MKFRLLCALGAILALSYSCKNSQSTNSLQFTLDIYSPSYATGFEILGSENSESSLLRITRPWQGESVECFELLILRGKELAPADFKGTVIHGDAKRIVALSSSNVAMFDRIGVVDRVVGVSGLDYISSKRVKERGDNGEVKDVGYDTNLNYELLTMLKPDIVLLYSVAGANNSVTSKLDELDIPYVYIGDYAEESPLGKAEWMVAMGEICGMRESATTLFNHSATRYNELCCLVEGVEQRPKCMLNTPYRDVWYMPSSRSYMVQILEDAGAEYIYNGNNSQGTKPISVEEAYKLATNAEIWLNTGATINSLGDLRSQVPKFMDMPMVKSGMVYNNTARCTAMGGSDFWESGVVHPDVVLKDLIEIFHPELLEHELYYYKKLE
ncbi:MAG: ABC transporter substrate-binding protein [Rikenellaceae bacterium]